MYDVYTKFAGKLFVDRSQLEHNYRDGVELVGKIVSGKITGDRMVAAVRNYLMLHARVVGTQKIAEDRLDLYLRSAEPETPVNEIACLLGKLIDDAVAAGRDIIRVHPNAARPFGWAPVGQR